MCGREEDEAFDVWGRVFSERRERAREKGGAGALLGWPSAQDRREGGGSGQARGDWAEGRKRDRPRERESGPDSEIRSKSSVALCIVFLLSISQILLQIDSNLIKP